MYEVCPRLDIVKFQPIDLSGEAKQTPKSPHTSADLFLQLSPVSELLSELTYTGNALRVKSLTPFLARTPLGPYYLE